MGRSPKKAATETTESSVVEITGEQNGPTLAVMTHHTYGITDVAGKMYVARINYNPITKEAQVVELEPADGRTDAQNRFRVNVAREVFKST